MNEEETRPINENSLLEIVKHTSPDTEIHQMAESLFHRNPILLDAVFKEASKGDYEERDNYEWSRNQDNFIEGKIVGKLKFQTLKVEDSFRIDRRKTSEDVIEENFPRLERESIGIINDHMSTILFEFDGFECQHSKLAENNKAILRDAGGTGNRKSDIWFVRWGFNAAYMIYPSGKPAGLDRILTKTNAELKLTSSWQAGLVIWDAKSVPFHSVVRIYNIDKDSVKDLPDIVRRSIIYFDQGDNTRTAIYSDRETLEITKDQNNLDNANKGTIIEKDVYGFGFKTTTVLGIPWHPLDVLNKER